MAAIGAYLAANLLSVSLKLTASWTSPASLVLGACSVAPTSVALSELSGGGYTAKALSMGAVAANGTKASNAAAVTFGTFTTSRKIVALVIKDSLPTGTGHIHYFGSLTASVVCSSGDTLVIAAGALTISLQ